MYLLSFFFKTKFKSFILLCDNNSIWIYDIICTEADILSDSSSIIVGTPAVGNIVRWAKGGGVRWGWSERGHRAPLFGGLRQKLCSGFCSMRNFPNPCWRFLQTRDRLARPLKFNWRTSSGRCKRSITKRRLLIVLVFVFVLRERSSALPFCGAPN